MVSYWACKSTSGIFDMRLLKLRDWRLETGDWKFVSGAISVLCGFHAAATCEYHKQNDKDCRPENHERKTAEQNKWCNVLLDAAGGYLTEWSVLGGD